MEPEYEENEKAGTFGLFLAPGDLQNSLKKDRAELTYHVLRGFESIVKTFSFKTVEDQHQIREK